MDMILVVSYCCTWIDVTRIAVFFCCFARAHTHPPSFKLLNLVQLYITINNQRYVDILGTSASQIVNVRPVVYYTWYQEEPLYMHTWYESVKL